MAFIVGLFVVVAGYFLVEWWLNREVASAIEVSNENGSTGTALVVYHPGRGGFGRKTRGAFVASLEANGWRVETSTASAQAPSNLAAYDLLVLSGPIYGFAPSRPLRSYLRRLGDLHGKPTVAILTGMGAGERADSIIKTDVQRANGELVASLLLYSMKPNEDLYGTNDPVEIATQAAKAVSPPQ